MLVRPAAARPAYQVVPLLMGQDPEDLRKCESEYFQEVVSSRAECACQANCSKTRMSGCTAADGAVPKALKSVRVSTFKRAA